ncbi:uncharacterized protein [Onthophagus taurus]|uniref:uncharacterized protein n=1 Tax=Onthophagus taurus TaxID=166361 RepID=UPI0039BE0031
MMKMSGNNERKIRDVRDVWGYSIEEKEAQKISLDNNAETKIKHKYKTLERHLSMKKTIRKKMMRDLREIGDASNETQNDTNVGFLEQIRTDQPPSANVDKPSLWKRLTKGWGHS